ncbi:predicted protein [Nematostella vectensis]|uniref:ATP synthase subunit n=1 Tax=Nematostella vectensis TaxID=45351 RepID=A7S8G1_NEMVE|nr:ATP synthase subunit g, mitochondrial [Nematostella vectensis]EDO39978.1 predicted protein [Nematostella vectensis]|eukprot:XP_001632041.1 predicted protein [Nematostella vectensis]
MAQRIAKLGSKIATQAPALATRLTFQATATARKAQPMLGKFWTNARVELAPPMPSEWPAIQKSFMNLKDAALSGRFLNVTVKEGVANTLVAAEIAFWFYIGEIIGRRSLIGYNV